MPGRFSAAKYPNWVTCPWPPEYLEVLRWQWEEVAAPYWIERAKFAADHGVKIAIEMHPGFLAYSPETLLKLRAIAGPSLGCNYDPSHMFWQGIDPIAAIRVLGDAIFHVHAKDTQMYPRTCRGPACSTPRTTPMSATGAGFSAPAATAMAPSGGREFVSTLRMFGYDYVLSIEHEDSLDVSRRRPDESGFVPERNGD